MKITRIIVHASDTFSDMDIGAKEIRKWHLDRGFSSIGYHYIIRRNGDVEIGRRCEDGNYVQGAHVLGLNANSLGVCMVGGKARKGELACNYTRAQWRALESLMFQLTTEYPDAEVSGHNDHDKGKQCPTFNVRAWWRNTK